ncbi:hypothetical protein ACJ73_07169 [Blastomyces percursus]|uniref:Uncharacterized protein n=1 Tax=Blastomyces percursus TaxID=1658174 RepID=A0A1J9QZ44_9EURO|nr:hypothetical protein ACJ73_07169 [Blastomyces percursus]
MQRSEYANKRVKMQARHEFLAHLPPDTHEYKYHGFSSLKEVTNKEYNQFLEHDNRSPYIIFTNISPEEFVIHNEDFPGRVDYSPPLQVLILTMVCLPHEEAASLFDQIVGEKAVKMKIRRLLSFRAATRSKTPDRNKQADRSYGPRELPPGRSAEWPTVAVEVGFSETREKLKSDAAYWLNQSSGDVLTMITIDIKRGSGNIYIILWKRPVVTNEYPNPEPEVDQKIKIYRGKGSQAANLTGDELRIPFRHMMLRDPRPGEGDFVITRDELLHDLADGIWWGIDHK